MTTTETQQQIESIDTSKDQNVDERELTEFLVLKNTTTTTDSKNTFLWLINDNKETIKKLPGFTDSLEKVATEIAGKLKIEWKIQDKIALKDNTSLTKNECAKILQVYAAIILNKNLTTRGETYKKWTDVLFDFESKHTFGPQMNAIIATLTKTTIDKNDWITQWIIEAHKAQQLNKTKTSATKKINSIYPENDEYDIDAMKQVNEIKKERITGIKNATTIEEIEAIITQTEIDFKNITSPLLTEKKKQTNNWFTEKNEKTYTEENLKKIGEIEKTTKDNINNAKTPAEIDKIMADAQTIINNIPTKYQEKKDEQEVAQKESDSFTYEKVGKEWKVSKLTEVNIPITQWMNGWASMPIIKNISTSTPTKMEMESKNLNIFMNLDSKTQNFFKQLQTKDLVAFITKNYPSLSKNSEIRDQINSHIKNYLKEKNHKPNINLYGKDLTDVSLEIDETTGEYYFNIPAEGNFGTYSQEKITTLHLGINGEVTEYDETKNPDSILASIYTKDTLAYTLTHNTYNDQFSELPGHIVPGTYQDKKNLLLIEAIKAAKNNNITDKIQDYKILTVEKNKIVIEATAKSGTSAKEGTLTIVQNKDWTIASGWEDKHTNTATITKPVVSDFSTNEEDIIDLDKKQTPLEVPSVTSQKDIENIINPNNNIIYH